MSAEHELLVDISSAHIAAALGAIARGLKANLRTKANSICNGFATGMSGEKDSLRIDARCLIQCGGSKQNVKVVEERSRFLRMPRSVTFNANN